MKAPPGMVFKMNPATGKYQLVPAGGGVKPPPIVRPDGTGVVNPPVVASRPADPGPARPDAVNPSKPTGYAAKYGWVTRNGKRVLVQEMNMTNAERDDFYRRLNAQKAPGASTGGAADPGATKPAADPQPGYEWKFVNGQWVQVLVEVDPRDGDYQAEMAGYADQRDRDLAAAKAERDALPGQYNRGSADIRTWYDQDRYGSNADLAARGIVRSGEFQRRGANRLLDQSKRMADLDAQYGSGAQGRIAARVAEINRTFGTNSQTALKNAKENYMRKNPASNYLWANVGGN